MIGGSSDIDAGIKCGIILVLRNGRKPVEL
jgi:hypothetical protein